MIYVQLPPEINEVPQRLPFYLAMEEFLARYRHEEYFFMWQVEPTVIFGRNQVIDAEVNLDYCRAEGIATYRRKSGGGCVFADMNNIMFSHITSSTDVVTTFSDYCRRIVAALRTLGLDASTTGRNDILIGDRKVSGNAFYHLPGRSIVHGTMLYDADVERMTRAITPSKVKLSAKGVASVRSHVTTVSEHLHIGLEEFKTFCKEHLCDSTVVLDNADIEMIESIAEPYYSPQWIFGRCAGRRSRSLASPVRIEGVGEFYVDVSERSVPSGSGEPSAKTVFDTVDLSGDFFLVGDLDVGLLDRLRGVEVSREAVSAAIAGIDVSRIIAGLTNERFIDLLVPLSGCRK